MIKLACYHSGGIVAIRPDDLWLHTQKNAQISERFFGEIFYYPY